LAVQDIRVSRYFFHLCDGHDTLIDPEGREIDDFSMVRDMTLREARGMISQDAIGGRIMLDQHIEVRNADGKLVHQLSFRDAVTISG